ncbi:hypothetical protein MFLAVUS_008429 [Mucor flavus]|uniref:Uncharacterized protein n=1 Tax=Mucor flavus TaxID=439312 RepID=A0ABP9Z719_9FUNG
MEVDQDTYPVEMVTDFNIRKDTKPPEKEIKIITEKPKEVSSNEENRNIYQHYKDVEKELLLDLVINHGMSASKLNIKTRIAQIWVKEGSGRSVG